MHNGTMTATTSYTDADRGERGLLRGLRRQTHGTSSRAASPRGSSTKANRQRIEMARNAETVSNDLCPTDFVLFLQNHDQIGNRAFGDRLTASVKPEALEAAIALQLLCPQIPLISWGRRCKASPFQFFTDHHGELADAVREGRRKEFASFASFSDPARRAAIPDPNAAETSSARTRTRCAARA